MAKYTIINDTTKKVKKFNLSGRNIEFKINPVPNNQEPTSWIRGAIEDIIDRAVEELDPDDYVGLDFCSNSFLRGGGFISFRRIKDLSFEDVWKAISGIHQSNSAAFNTETFCLGVTLVKIPIGRGRGRKYNSFEEESLKRSGIITVKNNDNLCLPIAVIIGKAFVEKNSSFEKIRKNRGLQRTLALELLENCKLVISEEGGSVEEIKKIQEYLPEYKITVYLYGTKGRSIIFQQDKDGLPINLLFNGGNHFNVITSLTSAFCCKFFCTHCRVPFDHTNEHRCQKSCPACREFPICRGSNVHCSECNRHFRGQSCFDIHIKNLVCEQIRKCTECLKTIPKNRQHICNEIFCKVCAKHVPENHQCYIPQDTGSPKTKDILFVFYDFESRQEKQLEDGTLLHEPNLCVFSQFCDQCENSKNILCMKCGVKQQILRARCVPSFIEYLLNQRKLFKMVIAIAHNAQGYDLQFILHQILTTSQIKPELIMRGTKIVVMVVQNIRFLDSMNYFPVSLAHLPQAFDLVELRKGYFPHLFNKIENYNYIGSLPNIHYYDPDNMSPEKREIFVEWYNKKVDENYVFNFKTELVEYCVSDVQILMEACKKFRKSLLELCNVCAFTDSVTIAGMCNKIFRRNFLKPNTVGIIPRKGYRYGDIQSRVAIQWMLWEEKQRDIQIIHAARQREVIIQGIKIDGFCQETNEIFQFHGCYYHGHLCFPCNRDKPLYENSRETLNTRYERTQEITLRFQKAGYNIIQMWECNFKKLMLENKEIEVYTKNHPLINHSPLLARDSFTGGRTENFVTHIKVKNNEKIKFVDVISLYPAVCKKGIFPVGHPSVLVGKECPKNISNLNGLIKCKILPPRNLLIPVLPYKTNNKLMFVLCRACGERFNSESCNHTDEERALVSTWVIPEVILALDKGYEIQEIYEIWKYDNVVQMDRAANVTGLFTEMMDMFIKIKTEASGWPKECKSEEQKQHYIKKFYDEENIMLDYNKIVKNGGLRTIGKLALNSFWGKWGESEKKRLTKIIDDPSELYSLLTNPSLFVNSCFPVNETVLIVSYEYLEDSYDLLSTVNVVIAAYVTAQARILLYNYMDLVKERVIYADTDSISYLSSPELDDIPTGSCIGDMSDELEKYGEGSYITDFVSGGAKNYAYKIWCTTGKEYKVVCKVKGISLTHSASQIVNFESIKKMVLDTALEPLEVKTRKIRRTNDHRVITKEEVKKYKPILLKRKFCEDGSSYPYGFKKLKS